MKMLERTLASLRADLDVILVKRSKGLALTPKEALILKELSRWFRNNEAVSDRLIAQVRDHVGTILNHFKDKTIPIPEVVPRPTPYAFSIPDFIPIAGGYFAVYDLFFVDNNGGPQPIEFQVGILFHESTHIYIHTHDHGYYDVNGFPALGDGTVIVYGDDGVLAWGQLLYNADTYEGFLRMYLRILKKYPTP